MFVKMVNDGGQYHVGSAPRGLRKAEVFANMANDSIGQIIRNDQLIIQLGNDSLLKNIKNSMQRGIYPSGNMRLCARVLQHIQVSNDETLTWAKVLAAQHFQLMAL